MQSSKWLDQAARFSLLGALLFFSAVFYGSLSQSREEVAPLATRATTKGIEEVRLGERIIGRNPNRSEAEAIEPDAETWRALSLRMQKPSGKKLWIELLRPLDWIEEYEAKVGSTIDIDLHEMGAIGSAEVLSIHPCPKIQPGTGTIITGTFKHEIDQTSRVLHLHVEDQSEPTTVTDNHPYWSVDRRKFVPAGELGIGEHVDTSQGPKRITALAEIPYSGFVHNLETTEHVFRVGSFGALVHNSCPKLHDIVPYSVKAPGFEKHHAVLDQWARANSLVNYTKKTAPTIVMTAAEHNATRRVFGQWRFQRTGSINGAIDWTAVTPHEIQVLNNQMLTAANIPAPVRDAYMQALNKLLYTGSF